MEETQVSAPSQRSEAALRGGAPRPGVPTHLEPREEADVHEGVHVLQVLVDVQGGDEGCRETEPLAYVAALPKVNKTFRTRRASAPPGEERRGTAREWEETHVHFFLKILIPSEETGEVRTAPNTRPD